MTSNKISLPFAFKKVWFPMLMTIFSFLLFVMVYLIVTVKFIEPYYFEGLIFAVPFICFGCITFLTAAGKLKTSVSFVITGVLVIVLGLTFLVIFSGLVIKASSSTITNINKYERILEENGYPNNLWIEHFPDTIPKNAENIVFSYNPGFLQAGAWLGLKFKTDADSIENYISEWSQKANWSGKLDDHQAEANHIMSETFRNVGYIDLPEDFIIYIMGSKPGFNHGAFSLVAISKQRNEIIFLFKEW